MTFDREGRLVVAGWSARTIWRLEKDGSFVTHRVALSGQEIQQPERYRRAIRRHGLLDRLRRRAGRFPGWSARTCSGSWTCRPCSASRRRARCELVIEDTRLSQRLVLQPGRDRSSMSTTRGSALIRAFDVNADGSVRNGRVFHKLTGSEAGVADGMKCDQRGQRLLHRARRHPCHRPGRQAARPAAIPGHATNIGLGRRRLALALRDHLRLCPAHAAEDSRRSVW